MQCSWFKQIVALTACVSVAAVLLGRAPVESAPSSEPNVSVLFIGNSYTYFNNMPAIFAAIAGSMAHPRHIIYAMDVAGGATLKQLYGDGATRTMLGSRHWDYVVLQEQSALEMQHLSARGLQPGQIDLFQKYAGLFYRAIIRAGARPILYLTWQRKDSGTQPAITAAYMTVAKMWHIPVAPVGIVYLKAGMRHLNLYQVDHAHPTPLASYLIACTIAATIFRESPSGAVVKVIGPPTDIYGDVIDNTPGTVHASIIPPVSLVQLDARTGHALQDAAWEVVRSMPANSAWSK